MPIANDGSNSKHGVNARPTLSRPDREQIEAIDAVIDRMRKLTEPDPYMLTIPQDEGEPRYHHYSRTQAEAWLYGSPFTRREQECTQYQSFIFHEPGTSIYVQLPNIRSDDVPPYSASQRSKAVTSAPTANTGVPKKTMSLGDYKKKQQGGASTTPELRAVQHNGPSGKQSAVKGPVERVKIESEDILASVADEPKHAPPAARELPVPNTKPIADIKRKRESIPATNPTPPSQQAKVRIPIDDSPPAKKARTSLTAAARNDDEARVVPARSTNNAPDRKKERDSNPKPPPAGPPRVSPGMPPRLSPGDMPMKLSPLVRKTKPRKIDTSKPFVLPRCISPLPIMFWDALQLWKKNHPDEPLGVGGATAAGGKKVNVSTARLAEGAQSFAVPRSIPPKEGRTRSKSPAARPSKGYKAVPSDVNTPKPSSTVPSEQSNKQGSTSPSSDRALRDGRSVQPSLLVRLKYRKSRREDIQRILRMRPQAAKKLPSQNIDQAREHSLTEKGKPLKSEPTQQEIKVPINNGATKKLPTVKPRDRHPEDEATNTRKVAPYKEEKGEPSLKRKLPDVPESRKRPYTPVQPDESPSSAPLSSHKGHAQATPSTRRDILSAAMKREFSSDSIANQTPPAFSTPNINHAQSTNLSRPPSSQPNMKTPKQQEWDSEHTRLQLLGRELKHAASSLLERQRAADPNRTTKEQKLAAIKSVESLLCFILAFSAGDEAALAADPKRAPRPDPWESLRGFFAFVKRNAEPFAPLSGLAYSLEMVSYARVLEIHGRHPVAEKGKSDVMDFQTHMQVAAREADSKLDIDTLLETFPRTWAKRFKGALPSEQLDVTRYSGPYKLPITMAVSPVRAVRATYAMLQEWVDMERLEYDFKLKL